LPTATDSRQTPTPFDFVNRLTIFSGTGRTQRFVDALLDTSTAAVGQTPKSVIWQRGPAKLYRYRARTTAQHPVPLLIVHSLISRSYILDLIPGNSFVEYLLDQGFDVYLTDWGVPSEADARLSLDDYVLDFLPRMVQAVLRESEAEELSMLGYCMGGLLTLLYAATHPDSPVRNVLSLATPVDFDHLGLQGIWGRSVNADRLVDSFGNIPAELIKNSFRMLKPASEFSPVRYIGLWQNVEDDRFIEQFRAFDRWTQEHIPFAGETFRQTSADLVKGNKLVRGGMEMRGIPVDLKNITRSFLAIAAEGDHIVPMAATDKQIDLVGSEDKEFLTLPGGHVGLVAGRGARKVLWPKVASWLAQRSAVRVSEEEYAVAAD
jgi:polyhydroxyalkanoate synthase subunit PhaC